MAMCEVCEKNPSRDAVILIRMNPKGVSGIFRCTECLGSARSVEQQETLAWLVDTGLVRYSALKDGACRWHTCQPATEVAEEHAPATIGALTGAPCPALHRTQSETRDTLTSLTQHNV